MKKKLAILGHPIKNSLSPKMHNYWLKKLNINGNYKLIDTPLSNFKKKINYLSKKNYKGLNLTIPLKEEAIKFLNKKDKIVKLTGAVNVLIFSKKKIEGKNTDVYGFKKSLINIVKNKKKDTAIIIGAGGAARAVLFVLIEMKYKKIFLFNRSNNNLKKIKKDFSKLKKNGIFYKNFSFINSFLNKTNLLVNTTPLGMKGFPKLNINVNNLKKNSSVFDLIYNPLETKLIKDSKKNGLKNTNGLDMLIYQAQRSFNYWFKKTPKITKELKKILEKEIK